MRKRRADFVTNLVVLDQPHLIYLRSDKTHILAVAVDPIDESQKIDFFATSVSKRNWDRYLSGHVDLRFLLSYAMPRTNYSFSRAAMYQGTVMMTPFVGAIPESYLPEHGLFSDAHTEPFDLGRAAGDFEENLFIAGEWGFGEFGSFYQRFADLYAFNIAVDLLGQSDTDADKKRRISSVFLSKPFQGGSSYVQMFDDFEDLAPREDKLALEGVQWNSPGTIKVSGAKKYLNTVESMIVAYLANRIAIMSTHQSLRGHLTRRKLLKAAPTEYDFTDARYLTDMASRLMSELKVREIDEVFRACNEHPLIFSKVALSIFRRVSAAAGFFAEGRISYEPPEA